jgi:hypothetical protein
MKTAVEKLFNIWLNREYITEDEWLEAIEMEKEQMVNAWENGKKSTQCKTPICRMKTGIGYYNKTFKQEQ